MCLVFHIAIFINSAFIGPYFEVLLPSRAYQDSETSETISAISKSQVISEGILRGLIAFLILWQVFLINKSNSYFCFASDLIEDYDWITFLVVLQVAYLVIFMFWRGSLYPLHYYINQKLSHLFKKLQREKKQKNEVQSKRRTRHRTSPNRRHRMKNYDLEEE